MPAVKPSKSSSDKGQMCRTLVTSLQKLYGKTLPRLDLPVLETFLFAICLEDNPWDSALAGYQRLLSAHFDLNEMRVSSVTELEQILSPLRHADWKGLRIRSILRYVFESTYSFDFEKFRRLTQEVAVKNIKKINDVSPFVRDFALQHLLGSHVISIDNSMLNAGRWLGIIPAEMGIEAAGEHLKGILKKSQGTEFCYLLRCLATDEKYYARFSEPVPTEIDSIDIPDRLNELQSPTKRKVVRPVVAAAPPKAAASKPAPAAKPAVSSPKTPVTSPKTSDKNVKPAVPAKAEKSVRKETPAASGSAAKDKQKIVLKETDSAGKKAAPAKARTASSPPKAAARGNDRKKK